LYFVRQHEKHSQRWIYSSVFGSQWSFEKKNTKVLNYYREINSYYSDEVLLASIGQSRGL